MDINSKDDLLSVISDMQSRLAMVEDTITKVPKDKKSEDDEPQPTDNEEVESVDEIEKLLNS